MSDSQVRGSGEEGFVVRTGSVQVKTKNKHLVQWKQKKALGDHEPHLVDEVI